MQLPDYYAILGVNPTATATDIKQAYRKLVRLHHPDINQQQQASRIKRINEAYTILSDPQKRAAYNALLLEEYQRIMTQKAAVPPRPQSTRQEHKMTWAEGFKGFVEELKKGMKEE
jgi:curved DNA-binding protein CbpA